MVLKRRSGKRHHRLSIVVNARSTTYRISSIALILWGTNAVRHLHDFNLQQPLDRCVPTHLKYWAIETASTSVIQTVLMVIFSRLTIIWRQDRSQFVSLYPNYLHIRRMPSSIESQLTLMIIMKMFVVVSTSLPYSIYILYRLITINQQKNVTRMIWKNIGENLIRLTIFFEPSCGFYIYFFSLTTLKQRFYNVIRVHCALR